MADLPGLLEFVGRDFMVIFFGSGGEFLLFFSGVLKNHAWMFQIVFKNTFHANVLGDFDMVIGLN
jgi:hypothetical protein